MSTRAFRRPAVTILVATVALSIGSAARAAQNGDRADAVPSDRAEIHFVDFGGIRNWRADNRDTLYIEAQNRKWYKATFFGPCSDLPTSLSIGFVSEPSGSVDKFSSIVVRGPGHITTECHFKTFDEVSGPPPSLKNKPAVPDKTGQ